MRINHTLPPSFAPLSAKNDPPAQQQGEDRVQISNSSHAFADPQRIEQLAAAVAAGTYNVSADKIAASLIQETMLSSGL